MTGMGTTGVLEVTNLSTQIRLSRSVVEAVGNVDFAIGAGETLGLVGESGCGKSMTGLSLIRLLPNGGHIVGGSIKLRGLELVDLAEDDLRAVRGNEIAIIFQDSQSSLNPTMPIGRQVAEPVRLHRGVSKSEARERALEVPALPVPVVDTVAAGDTFCGVFASALARGSDVETGLVRATAAGALAVGVAGATPSLPRAEAVDQLLSRFGPVSVRKLSPPVA